MWNLKEFSRFVRLKRSNMKVQELMEMMYPDTQIHILNEQKQELFSGTADAVKEEFFQKEIKHVWGQADLGGMQVIIKHEE